MSGSSTAQKPAQDAAPSAPRFGAVELDRRIAQAIQEMGYARPTPVQDAAIPVLLQGQDALVQAQTGTGKTAAFGIPVVARMLRGQRGRGPRALIICPTRELARQVADEITAIAVNTDLRVLCVYGGTPVKPQANTLKRTPDVVVGTPGRIIDLFDNYGLRLDAIELLILDEADRLLDMGFAPDVLKIVRRTAKTRQSVLCSATIASVEALARQVCQQRPIEVTIEAERPTVDAVDTYYVETLEEEKTDALVELIDSDPTSPIHGAERVLVFRRRQVDVEQLHRALQRRHLNADYLHGGLSQNARENVLQRFKSGGLRILVTTNVAARGLDIEDLGAVVQYDIPEDLATYVHRVGRTARAGRSGTAMLFVGPWDHDLFEPIREAMGERLRQHTLSWYRYNSATG